MAKERLRKEKRMRTGAQMDTEIVLDLEKDGVVPIYIQLARALEQRITSGALRAGDRLDSEAALCAQFDISRVTARLAVDELAKKGLIERKQGKGTYVSGSVIRHAPADVNQFLDSIFARGLNPKSRLLHFAPQRPPPAIASLFALEQGAELMRMDRLYILNEQRLGFSEGWMPLEARRFAMEAAEKLSSAKLLAEMGYSPVETEVAIGAGPSNEIAAKHLELPLAAPVLLIERNRFLPNGSVVEHVHFTMNPSIYKFEFRTKPATS